MMVAAMCREGTLHSTLLKSALLFTLLHTYSQELPAYLVAVNLFFVSSLTRFYMLSTAIVIRYDEDEYVEAVMKSMSKTSLSVELSW